MSSFRERGEETAQCSCTTSVSRESTSTICFIPPQVCGWLYLEDTFMERLFCFPFTANDLPSFSLFFFKEAGKRDDFPSIWQARGDVIRGGGSIR